MRCRYAPYTRGFFDSERGTRDGKGGLGMTGLTRLADGFGCSLQRRSLSVAVGAVALLLTTMASATPARAALGYEPDASTPSISLAGELPHGVAIDQANQRIYVTML